MPEPAFVATWRRTPARSAANARLSPFPSTTTSVRPPTTAARPDPRATTESCSSFDARSAAHAAARGAWPNAVPETMPMMLAVRPTASEIVR